MRILFIDCIVVEVGSSRSNFKTIDVPKRFTCPSLINETNWMGAQPWWDRFSVVQTSNQIIVTRNDKSGGWEMNLEFLCCSEKGIILT